MPRVTDLIRRSVLKDVPERMPDLSVLKRTERDPLFERLRMNRKIMGAFRYGSLGAPGKPKYDRVNDMIRRLRAYEKDHNSEHLVDVANLAELEFVEGDGVMQSQSTGEHTKEI